MKWPKISKISLAVLLFLFRLNSYSQVANHNKTWEFSSELSLYLLADNSFLLPVMTLDNDRIHFEGRYNYEDLETLSLFAGYNISFGEKLPITITPMIGGATGNTNAVLPALELTITYKNLTLYSEQEYLIDLDDSTGNFYYQWTDLAYSLTDWMSFGLSIQRTKLFESETELDHGILLTFGKDLFTMSGYYFNMDTDEPFGILTINSTF